MQHQRAIVKKKVTEGTNPLRHGLRRATSPEGERFWQYGKAFGFANAFLPWGKDSPAPGEVARSARRGTGGTKCRMRGE